MMSTDSGGCRSTQNGVGPMATADIATSEVLPKGDVYTRAALTEMFDITDATINTGIFQPKGQSIGLALRH